MYLVMMDANVWFLKCYVNDFTQYQSKTTYDQDIKSFIMYVPVACLILNFEY